MAMKCLHHKWKGEPVEVTFLSEVDPREFKPRIRSHRSYKSLIEKKSYPTYQNKKICLAKLQQKNTEEFSYAILDTDTCPTKDSKMMGSFLYFCSPRLNFFLVGNTKTSYAFPP